MKKRILFILLSLLLPVAVTADSLTIVSDTTTLADGNPSVACWVHPSWPSIAGATWIWSDYLADDESKYGPVEFTREFVLPVNAVNTSGTIQITTDNAYKLYVNGVLIGGDGIVSDPLPYHADDPDHVLHWSTIETYNFVPQAGTNEIKVVAVNYLGNLNPYDNPAGVIYKSDIEYETRIPAPEFGSIIVAIAALLSTPGLAYLAARRN